MGWMAYEDIKKMTHVIIMSEKTEFILDRTGYKWPSSHTHSLEKMIYEALKERASLMKLCPVFSDLSSEELSMVAARARQVYYGEDSEILTEGTADGNFYIIGRGSVSVSCTSKTGWLGLVSILGQGNIMGEGSIFEDSPSDIIAEAVMGDVLLFRLKNEDIRNLMNKIPQISGRLISELSSNLANLRKIIVAIG